MTRYEELIAQLKAAQTESEKQNIAVKIKALKVYEDAYKYNAKENGTTVMKQTVAFNYVLTVHQNLVDDHHCMAGIKDENLLHSAINGQYWYEPGIDQIIHVAYSICANHVFSDGNKRTAFLVLKLLEIDLNYICDWSQIASIILDLAANGISREQFHDAIIQSILFF